MRVILRTRIMRFGFFIGQRPAWTALGETAIYCAAALNSPEMVREVDALSEAWYTKFKGVLDGERETCEHVPKFYVTMARVLKRIDAERSSLWQQRAEGGTVVPAENTIHAKV